MATVLIVEDNDALAAAYADVLALDKHLAVVAGDGAQALRILEGAVVDLIVLDMHMPVMDGNAFLGERAKVAKLREIPVLVVTAFDAKANVPEVCASMVKPVSLDELQALVRRHARRPSVTDHGGP